MKIGYKTGSLFPGDRKFYIKTFDFHAFTHTELLTIINALASNEWLRSKQLGKVFGFKDAVLDAIEMGKRGEIFIDENEQTGIRPLLRKFQKRHNLNTLQFVRVENIGGVTNENK
jgi:hypothetical protein